jgi:hypothetical protein
MVRSFLSIFFPRGKHAVCRTMDCNESLDQEEESQWYEQCGELVEKLDSYKASIGLLSDKMMSKFSNSINR